MTLPNAQTMADATRLTRSGNLMAATAAIQSMLGARQPASPSAPQPFIGPTLEGIAEPPATPHAKPPSQAGTFTSHQFKNEAGARPYKLFVPSGATGQNVPLLIMLHGCTQSPDDFAAGTRMNDIAERETVIVAYPGQTQAGNLQGCWNWFNPANQARGHGEPAIIAGITAHIMRTQSIDPRRVYIAGLSAGGAQAAIMGQCYPDLYAAIGIHSGLACGAATDLPSALAAMQRGPAEASAPHGKTPVPTIIFHGDRDMTVNRKNADAIAAQATHGIVLTTETTEAAPAGQHRYRRTIGRRGEGAVMLEQWTIHGASHAWSGGSPTGSYTDARGPDASREMVRFFLSNNIKQ